ncbi:MAG TPA: YceD family protein [Burkholderiaceae bacterium]|nr:YceD family protein [Burkholderiaceae bacterium]
MSVPSPTIDSFEIARSRQRIEGEVAVARLPRLVEFLAAADGALRYRIDGVIDDQGHPAADLHLTGRLRLICQRCNAPFDFELDRTTRFRFVASEEELNVLPIEDDEIDAVVGSRTMNVHDWIEDEAILSLPLVPRHDECSPPLIVGSDPDSVAAPNPFAVLAGLRPDSDDEDRS